MLELSYFRYPLVGRMTGFLCPMRRNPNYLAFGNIYCLNTLTTRAFHRRFDFSKWQTIQQNGNHNVT